MVMKQLSFDLEFSADKWWKIDLLSGERVSATESEVELWSALMELANAPREPVIIEQTVNTAKKERLSKREAGMLMNSVAYVYNQLMLVGDVLSKRTFPTIGAAITQCVAIHDLVGTKYGYMGKSKISADVSVADVINQEIKSQQFADPDNAGASDDSEENANIDAAFQQSIDELEAKGEEYGQW